MLNVRANGMDVWFDNEWFVQSQPPEEMAGAPSLFMQDVHRWLYEYRKLDAMNARRDLRTITPESLMPYPAPWLSSGVRPSRVPHRRCAASSRVPTASPTFASSPGPL